MTILYNELKNFDWFRYKSDNKQVMIDNLSSLHKNCNLCKLCTSEVMFSGCKRSPHVFSNMCNNQIMIIGGYPSPEDATTKDVYSNRLLYDEFAKNNINKEDFYVTNIIKCCPGTDIPTSKEIDICSSYLKFEININKPKLAITTSEISFKYLCPEHDYIGSYKKIITSSKYSIKIFPLILPPIIDDIKFVEQMQILCKLLKLINL